MSRYLKSPPHPAKRPDGTRQCKWCAGDVKPPRRCWCSGACVDEYNVRAGNFIRSIVERRDKGVCAACGLDTSRVRKRYRNRRWAHLMAWVGLPVDDHRVSFFDVDHIEPVEKGGGACGLDNLQTLCVWCHKAKTKQQATERAKARRAQQELPL